MISFIEANKNCSNAVKAFFCDYRKKTLFDLFKKTEAESQIFKPFLFEFLIFNFLKNILRLHEGSG
jgi:hypothetical protein